MRKGLLGLIFLGIIVIAVSFDRLSPRSTSNVSQNPSQERKMEVQKEEISWLRYKDEDYQFELNYPSGWTVGVVNKKDSEILADKYIYFRPGEVEAKNPNYGAIQLSIYRLNLNIDRFIEEYICVTPTNCASAEEAKEVNVAGMKGKRLVNPPSPVPAETVSFKKGTSVFNLAVVLNENPGEKITKEEKKQIYQQIIDSFAFIDQTGSQSLTNFNLF